MDKLMNIPFVQIDYLKKEAEDFLKGLGIEIKNDKQSISELIDALSEEAAEDIGMGKEAIKQQLIAYLCKMKEIETKSERKIESITIYGGQNKMGEKEEAVLVMKPGDVVCIVGPTGSGKSRLLADIECLAQRDTPTKRQIKINGEAPDSEVRFSIESRLVAQISQNMNFIMDLTAEEFIKIHAESRRIENIDEVAYKVFYKANELSGEAFGKDTPVTALSGGQSRALMIADTALISASPIVLIDEIENAGVDRKKALELLVQEDKMVLMSTHDPILALMGHKRIVIRNGGIYKIIDTTSAEKNNLEFMEAVDGAVMELRSRLRSGECLDTDIKKLFPFLS